MSDRLRELARAWNDAWNGRDADALAGFFADGATYRDPNTPGPIPAGRGVWAAARKTWQDWPAARFEVRSIVVDGSSIALEWRSEPGLEGVDLLEVDGDRIAACRVYYDVDARQVEVGDDFEATRERIRQIEALALAEARRLEEQKPKD